MRRAALVVVMSAALSACVTTPPEQDPVVQRLSELDGRLLRIERILSNQSLLEQAQKVDTLANEVRVLRGQVEQLNHQVDSNRTQQRELYADVDRRMQAIESRPAASAPAAGTGMDDNAAYKQAFDLLKEGKYADAGSAFTQFLAAYPQSALRDNAQYWLGESRYVGKDFTGALREFRTLVETYPESGKLQDAWLKIGYCQYELKNWSAARDALKRAVQLGADTSAGKYAQDRLNKLLAEGR
jgi:tol-pal system protein YbgF